MGLDQSIKTTNTRIQDAMAKKGADLSDYKEIPEMLSFYEKQLEAMGEGDRFRPLVSKTIEALRQTVGTWRFCHLLHAYFEQVCLSRLGHGLEESDGSLPVSSSDLSNLLNRVLCVLAGYEKGEETGVSVAKNLLPNRDVTLLDGGELPYDEDYRADLVGLTEWLQTLLSIPGVEFATFRYESSF